MLWLVKIRMWPSSVIAPGIVQVKSPQQYLPSHVELGLNYAQTHNYQHT